MANNTIIILQQLLGFFAPCGYGHCHQHNSAHGGCMHLRNVGNTCHRQTVQRPEGRINSNITISENLISKLHLNSTA
jgi:hypothetical protein